MLCPAGKLPVMAAILRSEQQTSQAATMQQRPLFANAKAADMANISAGVHQRVQVAGMRVHADEAQLQAALPLPVKGRAKIPIMLHAPQAYYYYIFICVADLLLTHHVCQGTRYHVGSHLKCC
jgi:hypothetical protein